MSVGRKKRSMSKRPCRTIAIPIASGSMAQSRAPRFKRKPFEPTSKETRSARAGRIATKEPQRMPLACSFSRAELWRLVIVHSVFTSSESPPAPAKAHGKR
ncbi:hypothetical protein D3C72_1539070 [compost metagenome]